MSSESNDPIANAVRFDRLVHHPIRLAVLCALVREPALSFVELKKITGATEGNLSVHARKLEDGGYVKVERSFEDRMPKTTYAISARGRTALDGYLASMKALIRAVKTR